MALSEDIVDTGEAYRRLLNATALASGFLVEQSFELVQEERRVLARAHTVIDLVSEVYAEVDERLDFFIQTNDLSGDEIVEIPRGREVVFYK